MNKIIISLFLTGLLFGSGPCVASCGPFLITYVAGTKKNVARAVIVYFLFSVARISVYAGLGLGVFFLSRFAVDSMLSSLHRYVFVSGGAFIIAIGLFMTLGKRLKFGFWHAWRKNILEHDKKSVLLAGLIIGLLPCAPLLSVLAYVGLVSRTWDASLIYSLSFGVGTLASPLILLTVLAGLIPRILLEKKAEYYPVFSFICGAIIIFLGAQLILRAF
jgi:sulfite exporter TauE/SafE